MVFYTFTVKHSEKLVGSSIENLLDLHFAPFLCTGIEFPISK